MESVRQSKVAKLIQKELAELFRAEAKNMFFGAFISVTVVRVSPDLSSAKVYVSIMAPGKDEKEIFKIITDHNFLIRKKLGTIIGKQVRIIPELHFYVDDSYDYAQRINDLLNKPI
ncbi:MAG: 30S ribosome-binding factor RbfA [Bacteroidetes bacterium]|nr:30S ribosome-binding factor RbfA [Bacteroidota bacterium]